MAVSNLTGVPATEIKKMDAEGRKELRKQIIIQMIKNAGFQRGDGDRVRALFQRMGYM
jgi:hypothetical protein